MTSTPDDLLAAAIRALDGSRITEADCRIAVHAAYYALYHWSCAKFGLDPMAARVTHEGIKVRWQSRVPADAAEGRARRQFATLYRLRVRADYGLSSTITPIEAETALEQVRGVLAPGRGN